MNSIETIVLIFAILAAIKLLFVVFSPKSWAKIVKGLYKNKVVLIIVELILVILVFYYLSQTMTLVQIMAGIVLGALLTGLTFAFYAKDLLPLMEKMIKTSSFKKNWLPILIWAIIIIWIFSELF